LLAIAKYEDRFVIPTSHREGAMDPYRAQGATGYTQNGFADGCDGCGPVGVTAEKSGKQIYEENFYGGIWRDLFQKTCRVQRPFQIFQHAFRLSRKTHIPSGKLCSPFTPA